MYHPDSYMAALISRMQQSFSDRLRYVGLQGSYLRGEATEESDIDIMVVIDDFSPADAAAYRSIIEGLERPEKSCGFICGTEEMRHWNPLEICHLLHTTKDYLGCLQELVPYYTKYDVTSFIKLSLGNLYHEICHRRIHASMEENRQALPFSCKSVFFILQNLHYLRSGQFIPAKEELLLSLSGRDKAVLEMALSLSNSVDYDFDPAFSLLFSWCRDTLASL